MRLSIIKSRFLDVSAILLLVGVAAVLRIHGLDSRALYGDEYFTLREVRQVGLNLQSLPYFLLMHFWIKAGESDFWFRLFSVIWNVLWIPAMAFLGYTWNGRRGAVLNAVFACFSAFAIGYCQQVRFYTFFLFTATLSYAFFFHYIEHGKWRAAVLFWSSAALALISHFFGFLAVFPQVLFCFFERIPRRYKKAGAFVLVASGVMIAGALMLPECRRMAWSVVQQIANGTGGYTEPRGVTLGSLVKIPMTFYFFSVGEFVYPMNFFTAIPGTAVCAGLFSAGAWSLWRHKPEKFLFIAVAFLAGLAGLFLFFDSLAPANTGTSVRYAIFLLPLFYLTMSEGLLSFGPLARKVLATSFLITAALPIYSIWHSDWNYSGSVSMDWKQAALQVRGISPQAWLLYDGRSAEPVDRYFPAGFRKVNSWNFVRNGLPEDLPDTLIFISSNWRPEPRAEATLLLSKIRDRGYAVKKSYVRYPLFLYELKREGSVSGISIPLEIYGLQFKDLELPLKVRFEGEDFNIDGALSLPDVQGRREWVADVAKDGLNGRRILVLSQLTDDDEVPEGDSVAIVEITKLNGEKIIFKLKKGSSTNSWDSGSSSGSVYAWSKKTALLGQSAYPESARSFQARLFGAVLDLGEEERVIGVRIARTNSKGSLHIWGLKLS